MMPHPAGHVRSASLISNSDAIQPDGYTRNIFEGKGAQMGRVARIIREQGFLPAELIENEVAWFYNNLGIDDMYFQIETDAIIAGHIMGLYSAKIASFVKGDHSFSVNLEQESDDGAVYIHNSLPGVSNIHGPNYEKRIDEQYLDPSVQNRSYRLESYRSQGVVSTSVKAQLRCYFVKRCQFVCPQPTEAEMGDIAKVGDKSFLSKATGNTLEVYQQVVSAVLQRTGPVIELYEVDNSRQKRVIIGFRQKSTQEYFSALSDLYHYYRLYSSRKYVENFSNGVTIICLYLSPIVSADAPPIEHSIIQVMKEASLLYCLPRTPLQEYFQTGKLSVQETIYGYCGLVFAQHFLNRLGSEYLTLSSILDAGDPLHAEVLTKLKKRLRQETFTREYVLDIVRSYPELIRALYLNFAMTHYVVNSRENTLKPSLSFQRLQRDRILTEPEIREKIRLTVSNQHEIMVMEALLTFNAHILKTNFYQPTKVALSFRLDPKFLPAFEYPQALFGMFLVIGSEFRGFHLRFRDVARGGIRIIKSRNREAYSINLRSLFDENYALAATQQRKNKDIPEGGSKGTLLLDVNQQDKSMVAFQKYVDAVLDLLIAGCTPGIKDKIVDRYEASEILFFGPDEGTAEFMDWASQHARIRGAPFWKAFTTGKSQRLGGIPHDVFGMTTRSIHQYVAGIYDKLGLKERECRKLQTGGPDGDLGSNEIKISQDLTVAIVDGSGVAFDPEGLDRRELLRLAHKRQMICNFDTSLLSPKGFRILIDERGVTLPDGTVVEDGLQFRNEFHLLPISSADVFVPCGGRPEAVDINNVHRLLTEEGLPRFKYIVEGANLFFTQDARIRLEHSGAIIFKDASANKGGVTSSSLEVLAALALTDDEFSLLMQVRDGHVSAFYTDYVCEVHAIIERNARLEFECIWREQALHPTKTKSVISDELSVAIGALDAELQSSESLWNNLALRSVVLEEALPGLLVARIGLDVLMARIPAAYLKAIFASYLASRFIYQHGVAPSQFAFFDFMSRYFERVSRAACRLEDGRETHGSAD